HHPRQLAARCRLRQSPGRLTGVGREQERHLTAVVATLATRRRIDLDVTLGAAERELAEPFAHGRGQDRRAGPTGGEQRGLRLRERGFGPFPFRRQRGPPFFGPLELCETRGRLACERLHLRERRSVFPA